MNWLKRKIQQLSDKLNADESPDLKKEQNAVTGYTTGSAPLKQAAPDNIEELKEITIGAITRAIKMLGYGNTVVSGLTFHSRFADSAVENVGLQALMKDIDFVKQIKRTLKSKGVRYKDDLRVEVLHQSELTDKVTKITDGIGVEVLTPTEISRKIRARLIATEGITWESEYILEPTGKPYFIGRCKDPKIDHGPKIHNDIAFVGIEEKNEALYQINNYVSRSHAYIVFDKETAAYKIYRSKFLNNPAHKIKIYNTGLGDFTGISLTQPAVPHVLRNGDAICFNDKVVLEFYVVS
ncbi:hypothetical protein [Niabella aquatica]